MSDAAGFNQSIVTSDERTMGTLAHVLQLVGGWIAPLVIFLVKRNSRFVSFHALQALLLQGLYFVLMMVMMGAFFAFVFAGVAFHQPAAQNNSLPPAFIILFPVIWLGMMDGGCLCSSWPSCTESKSGAVNGPNIPCSAGWPAGF